MNDPKHDSFLITHLEKMFPEVIIQNINMSWAQKIADKLEKIDEKEKAKEIPASQRQSGIGSSSTSSGRSIQPTILTSERM